MRRCARWIPLFAVVAALPVLAADDDPKKPSEPDKKEMKKDDTGEARKDEKKKDDKPAAPPSKEQERGKYVEVRVLPGVKVKKFDSKSSEASFEYMVGVGRY